MITRIRSSALVSLLLASLFCYAQLEGLRSRAAAESVFLVQLIWGTDSEKPRDKRLKDVEPELLEKLKGVFKWKNYFEVTRKTLTVQRDSAPKLKLSDKCDIQVQDLGGSRIEVRLFGEGNLVLKKAQSVIPGEMIVLAGEGKDHTAWFVVLTPPK